MRVCSTISVSMLAAVTAATEAEWSNPNLDPVYLYDGVDFIVNGGSSDYLSSYGAYEPSKAEPYSAVASEARCKIEKKYPKEPVEYVDRKEDSYTGRSDGVRGSVKQSRRQEKPAEVFTDQPEVKVTRTNGRYYDWRDYDTNRYGGKNPYDECVFPEDTSHLDTPQYQALSAMCKTELMWKLILPDKRRERFYTGYEFESLF